MVNEVRDLDKRTVDYKHCLLAVQKGTIAMLKLLRAAKKAEILAKSVLFDSCFHLQDHFMQ